MNLVLHGVDIRPSNAIRAIIQVLVPINGQDVLIYEDTVTLTSAKARQKFIAHLVTHFQAHMHGSAPADFERTLLQLRQQAETLYQQQQAAQAATPQTWLNQLSRSRDGVPHETLGNVTLAMQHLSPWNTDCWYDAVRDLPMVGQEGLTEDQVTQAGLALERTTGMHVRSRYLIPTVLSHLCHEHPRDLLQEWVHSLPAWDRTPRLKTWLHTYAHAPDNPYSRDVSRLLIVSMIVRALEPGCLYRFVVILEGPENAGKTTLVRSIATPDWYRELSHGLDGKEAHMRIKRAWVAELSELSSMRETAEARLKSFFTMREDVYIPKYSNFEVVHKRRTVFIGTVNPEGDNRYMNGQTGNTRYLPIPVHTIDIKGFEAERTQIFAEALQDYRAHVHDWWELASEGSQAAQEVREERRHRSPYEDDLGKWLERHKPQPDDTTCWEEIATNYLHLRKDQWADQKQIGLITMALKALGWEKRERKRQGGVLFYPWYQTDVWHERKTLC